MATAVEVARGLLTHASELGVALSEGEVQRLAVHAQAWFMASHKRPLFEEPILAGEGGPVVPSISEALRNGGIARFASDDEAYELIGHYAFWQAGAAVADHVNPEPRARGVNAEIDAEVAGKEAGSEVEREALRCRAQAEIDRYRKPIGPPDGAFRRLEEDPEFLERLSGKAAEPSRGFRPR